VFDLNADPYSVQRVLQRDELLKRWLKKFPGIRIPGAWSPWELAVRAILGQQVSVAAANTLAQRLVMEFRGKELFPTPAMLAKANLETIGLPGARADAIRTLAQAVTSGKVDFDNSEKLREQLLSLKGIGPWTADYIALRASGDPDAFPESDLALRKALAIDEQLPHARDVAARAVDWSPWRGYAAMLLWKAAGNTGG
jgi:AraC family transcriptional regulator of adaptative response / DNA-3-methyladenine glycosylase II